MKHILGMAKSSLDLRGAKARNLELDVLRLVYAVHKLRANGEDAHGYVLVLDRSAESRVKVWLKKYEAITLVTCMCAELSDEDRIQLQSEKEANAEGMQQNSSKPFRQAHSVAGHGRMVGEAALRHQIIKLEPSVKEADSDMPLGVQWDFYGHVGHR